MTDAKGLNGRYPCPCCGHLVFDEPPGSYDICPICFWHDDDVQVADPWLSGGANVPSLLEAQRNYASFGAKEERVRRFVRPSGADDTLDPDWRPLRDSDRMLGTVAVGSVTRLRHYYWLRGTGLKVARRASILVTRDSVCAGDDADAPHRVSKYIPAFDDPVTLARELSTQYLASVAGVGHSWRCVLNEVPVAKITVTDIQPLVPACEFSDENTVHFVYHSATY